MAEDAAAFEHLVGVLRQEALISGLDDLPTNYVLIPAAVYLARQGGQFPSDAVRRRFVRWIFLCRSVGALLRIHRYQAPAGRRAGDRARPRSDSRAGVEHPARARSRHPAGRRSRPRPHRFGGRPAEPDRGAASSRPRLVHRRSHLRAGHRDERGRRAPPHLLPAGPGAGRIQRHDADQRRSQSGAARATRAQRAPRGVARRVSAGSRRVSARRVAGSIRADGPCALAARALPRLPRGPSAPAGRGDERVHRRMAAGQGSRSRAARACAHRRRRRREAGVQVEFPLGPPGGARQRRSRRWWSRPSPVS